VPHTKCFITLAIYCGKAYIVSTIISKRWLEDTLCMSSKLFYQPWWSFSCNLNGACQRDPIVQVGHGEANFTFPLCNYRYILLPLLLDPSEYSLVQRPVPLPHQYAQHLLWGITPTVSSDKNKVASSPLYSRSLSLWWYIDVGACRSCGSYWRQLSASLLALSPARAKNGGAPGTHCLRMSLISPRCGECGLFSDSSVLCDVRVRTRYSIG